VGKSTSGSSSANDTDAGHIKRSHVAWEKSLENVFFLTTGFPEPTGEARLTSWLRNPVQKSTLGKLLKTWVSLRYDEHMSIGYARVSTHEQSLSLQLDALKKAGCRKVLDDKTSGARSE